MIYLETQIKVGFDIIVGQSDALPGTLDFGVQSSRFRTLLQCFCKASFSAGKSCSNSK